MQMRALGQRFLDTIDAQAREAAAGGRRSKRADCLVAGHHGRSRLRRGTVISDGDDAGSCAGAMLDARDHFLADVTALVEIDAGELIEVGFVRKRVAVSEVRFAPRDAE